MKATQNPNQADERRAETRNAAEKYYSVQFTTKEMGSHYQFKIRDISSKGLCILVKEDSDVLKHIKVGDILTMTYLPAESPGPVTEMKTEIKHITRDEAGRYKGHLLVGLAIL
jgi:hypothetical protein